MSDVNEDTESNLVIHAVRELALIGEDPETTEGLVNVVRAFAAMGHSGGSASIGLAMIERLLRFENLTPLTDNPEEWQFVAEEVWGSPGGIWQNRRNSEAFSNDGGKTYYLLSEGGNDQNREPLHESAPHKKEA